MYIYTLSFEIRENTMEKVKTRAASGTVNYKQIAIDTIKRIKKTDSNSEWDQSERTRRHRALGTSVKNKLHDDGRKKEEKKIKISTYRRYLTFIRQAITAENWHHHSLDTKIQLLANRYPKLADKIKSIRQSNITETRLQHKAVLLDIRSHTKAYEDVKALKLDHEIMLCLTLPSAKSAIEKDERDEKLMDKKTATINVDYPWLMATIKSLLSPDTNKSISFSRLVVGIAFATGRRQVEVVYQGKFKQIGEYELEFSGAAKKRGGADYSKTYNIYTLVPAADVMNAFNLLKAQPEIMALSVLDEMPETKRNTAINQKMAKTLNTAARRIWNGDKDRKFKDCRPVWARIVFEQHFTQDKRWAKVDEDVFWHEQLCHEDIETQKAYKQFKILHMGEEAVTDQPTGRLEMIKALMNHPDIQRRGSLLKITRWAIGILEKDPSAKISQHRIIQEVGSGRPVIRAWKAIADPALAADAIQNSEVKKTPEKQPEKSPEKAPEKNKVPAATVKPRLKVAELRPGMFEVDVIIGNATHQYIIPSTSRNDALQQGWDQYIEENTSPA